jgi:hypothetical protein
MTDLATTSLYHLGEWIIADKSDDAYRAALGLVAELSSAPASVVAQSISAEPPRTGDGRVDALLAAIAEHLAFHSGLTAPPWCEAPHRFLHAAWYPVDLPSVRVRALVSTPASFWRRGIYIDRSDLDRP